MQFSTLSRREQVQDLIALAHAEPRHEIALQFLRSALEVCERWARDKPEIDATLLTLQVLAELALEEPDAGRRGDRWRRAVNLIKTESKRIQDPRLASAFGFVAVDCFQDILSDLPFGTRVAALRLARDCLNDAIRRNPDIADPAPLCVIIL